MPPPWASPPSPPSPPSDRPLPPLPPLPPRAVLYETDDSFNVFTPISTTPLGGVADASVLMFEGNDWPKIPPPRASPPSPPSPPVVSAEVPPAPPLPPVAQLPLTLDLVRWKTPSV